LKDYKNLVALEEKAKEEKVGRWADDKVFYYFSPGLGALNQ